LVVSEQKKNSHLFSHHCKCRQTAVQFNLLHVHRLGWWSDLIDHSSGLELNWWIMCGNKCLCGTNSHKQKA
jgi:hypothetical protein